MNNQNTMDSNDSRSRVRTAFCSVLAMSVERIQQRSLAAAVMGPHDCLHLFITFDVDAEGVELPDALKDQFPEGMTISLQYQYDDLECDDDGFSVTLIFDGQPARIRVPWGSIVGFVDESAGFAIDLQVGAHYFAEYVDEHNDNVVRLFPNEDT
jgi:hypothetical protein